MAQTNETKTNLIPCPVFSGEEKDYGRWRTKVEDWLILGGSELKHPGIHIRINLQGNAELLTMNMKREDLTAADGHLRILKELDSRYKKDISLEKLEEMMTWANAKRKPNENIKDFIKRYEYYVQKLGMLGISGIPSEVFGLHLIGSANLDEHKKLALFTAIGKEKISKKLVTELMENIFRFSDTT